VYIYIKNFIQQEKCLNKNGKCVENHLRNIFEANQMTKLQINKNASVKEIKSMCVNPPPMFQDTQINCLLAEQRVLIKNRALPLTYDEIMLLNT
jgi:hypothetical protein